MKTTLALLMAVASFGQATATPSGRGKTGSSPSHSQWNNKCNVEQKAGWDWSDLPIGKVGTYHGFDLNGWTCQNALSKRAALGGRTFGVSRLLSGICGQDVSTTPSIACSPGSGIDAFSISSLHISTEFDCVIEFHYEMPAGDICQTSHECSKSGTTVTNTQCGGAKKVSVVFPKQPNVGGRSSCQVGIHNINWNCNGNSPQPSTSIAVTTPVDTALPTTPVDTGVPTTPVDTGLPTTPVATGVPSTCDCGPQPTITVTVSATDCQ